MRFGDILRELLEECNLSQKQLADDLNISASAIGNYVRNNREPDFDTLKRLAAYFHVSTDFLLNYHEEQGNTYQDHKILQIFHALTEEQRELYIEQGKLFIKSNYQKNKKKVTSSHLSSNDKAI